MMKHRVVPVGNKSYRRSAHFRLVFRVSSVPSRETIMKHCVVLIDLRLCCDNIMFVSSQEGQKMNI